MSCDQIEFDFPELPVSVNKLYINSRGRKILSSEGRRYRNKFVAERGGASVAALANFEAHPDAEYGLELVFYLDKARLYNLTYGSDKRVKSPFKDIDVSNMIKLVEDCISALTGIRDRNNFRVVATKEEAGPKGERVWAWYYRLDNSDDQREA